MSYFRGRRLVAVFALSFLLVPVTACMPPAMGRADLLNFIEDGKTTREQTYLSLGEPAAAYEEERILCFRLGQDEGGDFVVGKASGFGGVRASLIMAFDEQGILKKHSVVQVKAP